MKSYMYLPISCLDFASVSVSGALDADNMYLCGTQTKQILQTEVSTTRVHHPLTSDDEAEFVDPSDITVPPASTFIFALPLLRFVPPHLQENRRTHNSVHLLHLAMDGGLRVGINGHSVTVIENYISADDHG